MGNHARNLRSLTLLPNGPCVLVLAHPTKNAVEPDGLVPKGGSSFLNEVDGNVGLVVSEGVIGAQVVGKFRGPEFPPMRFGLKAVRHPKLVDSKGRSIPTVVAYPLDEVAAATLDAAGRRDEDLLLLCIDKHPRASLRLLAALLGWKHHAKVERLLKTLTEQKLVKKEGRTLVLTQAGQKELNAQEAAVSPGAFSTVPFPPGFKGGIQ
jgi:hypothetical protein